MTYLPGGIVVVSSVSLVQVAPGASLPISMSSCEVLFVSAVFVGSPGRSAVAHHVSEASALRWRLCASQRIAISLALVLPPSSPSALLLLKQLTLERQYIWP